MPILYSLISRGPTILCSNQVGGGNYEQVVKKILPNIPTRSDARTTYTSDNYLFHVDVDNGMVYMCMSGPDDGKSVPYGFLTQIKQDFASQGLVSRAHFAEEMELQSQFKPTLQTQMEKFSSGSAQGASGGNQQLSKLQSQVDEVRDVMTQNIEKVLERGENLSDLEAKTEDLEYHMIMSNQSDIVKENKETNGTIVISNEETTGLENEDVSVSNILEQINIANIPLESIENNVEISPKEKRMNNDSGTDKKNDIKFEVIEAAKNEPAVVTLASTENEAGKVVESPTTMFESSITDSSKDQANVRDKMLPPSGPPPPQSLVPPIPLHPGLFGIPPPNAGEGPYQLPPGENTSIPLPHPAPKDASQSEKSASSSSFADPWTSPLVASCLALWDHNMWMRQFQQQLGTLLQYHVQLQPHLYNPSINQNAAPGLHMPPVRTYHNWKSNHEGDALSSCRDTVTDRITRSDAPADRDKNANAFSVPVFDIQKSNVTSVHTYPTHTSQSSIFTSPRQTAVIVPSDCDKQGLSYHEVMQNSSDRPISSLSLDSGIDMSRISSVSPNEDVENQTRGNTPPPVTPLIMQKTPPASLMRKGLPLKMPPMEESFDCASDADQSLMSEVELSVQKRQDGSCSIRTPLESEEESILTEESQSDFQTSKNESKSLNLEPESSSQPASQNNTPSITNPLNSTSSMDGSSNHSYNLLSQTSKQEALLPQEIIASAARNIVFGNENANAIVAHTKEPSRDVSKMEISTSNIILSNQKVEDQSQPLSLVSESCKANHQVSPADHNTPKNEPLPISPLRKSAPWQPWQQENSGVKTPASNSPFNFSDNGSSCSTPTVTPHGRDHHLQPSHLFPSPLPPPNNALFQDSDFLDSPGIPQPATRRELPSLSSFMKHAGGPGLLSAGTSGAAEVCIVPQSSSENSEVITIIPTGKPPVGPQGHNQGRSKFGTTRVLNAEAVNIMTEWYMAHKDRPYPSNEEKAQMALDGGITVSQVTSWFSNKRNRSGYHKRGIGPRRSGGEKRKIDPFLNYANDITNRQSSLDTDYIRDKVTALVNTVDINPCKKPRTEDSGGVIV